MEYRKNGNTIIIRLDRGEDIAEEIIHVAEMESIAAASVTGIGAVDDLTIGFYDLSARKFSQKRFTGPHEVTSLIGNITSRDGKPHLHLHITCGDREGNIVGGHLVSAVISLTGEIFINTVDAKVDRKLDESLGIYTMSL